MATVGHGLDSQAPPAPRPRVQCITPAPGTLGSADVRGACTASSTKTTYKSYLHEITKWIKDNLPSPESYYNADNKINVKIIRSSHFEKFLLDKMNSKSLKVSTLGGY
ncbi:unnamed protein product [Phytophthora lilii]|uniref:Unnamed protein product n=1 Tax=Phytophthora lilii TaxID=2077276 RepID=A0A9W6UAW5_9STRA|nr:unnamed protein product [Phytophthora lilii]